MRRRRFLAIAAAVAGLGAAPARAEAVWRGVALGADVAITLRGATEAEAAAALAEARATLGRMEALFSLHRPDSALARLNAQGRLDAPQPEMVALLDLCGDLHAATGGLFDPTVQPVWAALAAASPAPPDPRTLAAARARVGWAGVTVGRAAVTIKPGMALTLNGVAQGFATDRIAEGLEARGFAEILIDAGELRAGEGAWRVGVEDPDWGLVATRTLTRAAIATSSPGALRFGAGGPGHILDPRDPDRPTLWSSVAIEARRAAVADGLSTAACFLDAAGLRALTAARPDVARILTVDGAGNVRTL